MKKHLLTITLLVLSVVAIAQTKKTYEPDLTKNITVTMTLPAHSVFGYLFTNGNGGPEKISASDKLTGNQIQFYLRGYSATLDTTSVTLAKAYDRMYKEGEVKWAADTLKTYNENLKKAKAVKP